MSYSMMVCEDHLQEMQQELKAVLKDITSLAAAEEAGDMDRVRFLRDRLVQQDRRSSCCERKRTSSGLPDQ